MKDSTRDLTLVIAAAAGLFASVQSWANGRQLAELSGQVGAIERGHHAHVNTPHVFVQPSGLGGPEFASTDPEPGAEEDAAGDSERMPGD